MLQQMFFDVVSPSKSLEIITVDQIISSTHKKEKEHRKQAEQNRYQESLPKIQGPRLQINQA